MSAKVKLVSCIFGLIITIGMLVVGVLAATQSNFLFQGNLTFAVADKSLYVRNVRYQHGMNTPQNVPGFRQGFINGGFDLNMSNVDFGDNTTGTFVLYFDIINFVVDGTTHEYIASASWTNSAVSGVSFSIDAGSEKIEKGTVTPENLTDSTPISGSVALEIFVNNTTNFDLSNITISFSQSVNLDETDYVLNDDGGITINDYTGSGSNIVIPDSYTVGGMTYPVTSVGDITFSNDSNIQTVTLPDTITSIGANAFSNCSNMTTINLPEDLDLIDNRAFYDCSSLTTINLPEGLTIINSGTFRNCSSLTIINIPNSVTSIEGDAFYGCGGLTSVTIPNSVTSIGMSSFAYCSGLTSIILPENITELPYRSFEYCSSLTTFNIPNSVTTIGGDALRLCSALTSIIIPSSVTSIGTAAFNGCTGLNTVIFQGQVPNIQNSAFRICNHVTKYDFRNCTIVPTLANTDSLDHANNCQIIVPDALYDEWTQATNWVALTNVVWVKASEYVE